MREKDNYRLENHPELGTTYSVLQPYIGNTKHMGGLKATKKLTELCCVNGRRRILDVGCGNGRTLTYLAKKYNCRVIGIDISERMVKKSRIRAKREGLKEKVKFETGDAQNLLFEDDSFDVVIGESVTAFVEDKKKAVSEYVRVTKPGGYVGLNELTWIEKPTPEMIEYVSRIVGAEFSTCDSWTSLLNNSGLEDQEVKMYKINALKEWMTELRWSPFKGFFGGWYRVLSLYMRNSAFRRWVKNLWPIPKDLFKYWGYGIYVGRR